MPAPEPGEDDYPLETDVSTSEVELLEVFTLWLFRTGPRDAIWTGGAMIDGEHGENRTRSGKVSVDDELPFGPRDGSDPTEQAELHLVVTPRGALDAALLPDVLQDPVGDPTIWWMAFFDDFD